MGTSSKARPRGHRRGGPGGTPAGGVPPRPPCTIISLLSIGSTPSSVRNPLDDQGDPLPYPDAHRRQPVPPLPPLQLAEQAGKDARAAASDGLPQGDGAAVGVGAS